VFCKVSVIGEASAIEELAEKEDLFASTGIQIA
jgi:hypothetical protein